MKNSKIIQIILVVLQLCFLKVVLAPAQKINEVVSSKSNYHMLLTRFKVYLDYYLMSEEVKVLYTEASQYGDQGEYEIAIIMLEEAIDLLTIDSDSDEIPLISPTMLKPEDENIPPNFRLGIITGIDFNQQEFELSYLESDSTVQEEFNKPYVGLSAGYAFDLGKQASFELYNSFRYDRENLRDDYRMRWQVGDFFYLQYSGYWNQTKVADSYSYWEHIFSTKLGNTIGSNFYWSFYNIYNYKTYQAGQFTIQDYYRNRFNALLEWRSDLLGITGLEYANERNETLNYKENDYNQHRIRTGIRSEYMDRFYHSIIVDASLRDYTLLFADSLISNSYEAYSLEFIYEVSIRQNFSISIEDNFLYKIYQEKSTMEPDYYWNIFRPGVKLRMSNNLEIGGGYEWELKKHDIYQLDSYNVSEQNYRADGVFILLNYFSIGGTYISTSVSYQWRRYPTSVTNDLFSIYSNRNIFSAMMMVNLPLFRQLNLNGFLTYDNDMDIDFDQQNNQSTIFTIELEYTF